MSRKKKRKVSPQKLEELRFHRDIVSIFKRMGFSYLNTDKNEVIFDKQKSDIDSVYVYENIIVLAEETTTGDVRSHLKNKSLFFTEVLGNKAKLLKWLQEQYPDFWSSLKPYPDARYKIKYVYFHSDELDDDSRNQFNYIHFADNRSIQYFKHVSRSIQLSSRFELFKFLDLNIGDIGNPNAQEGTDSIDTAVILPESATGFPKGIGIVSFLMSANTLIQCGYVFRKEGWQRNIQLYQRLMSQSRIQKIREFVAGNKRTFINNIIVSLPSDCEFYYSNKPDEKIKSLSDVDSIENIKVVFKKKMNSLGIIDGQHRIYAHYESNSKNKQEDIIKEIREKNHLLVTGICFPKSYQMYKRTQFESDLFLQINHNQKKVDSSLLQHILFIKDPYSAIGVARRVLYGLNQTDVFKNIFQVSVFDTGLLKTPSIINWGLKDLVEISDKKNSLYKYWDHAKKDSLKNPEDGEEFEKVYTEYIKFCVSNLSQFFNAVRDIWPDDWVIDENKRLLQVTAITGFIISLRQYTEVYGLVGTHKIYKEKLASLKNKIVFDAKFPYKSSHWADFAKLIHDECWK